MLNQTRPDLNSDYPDKLLGSARAEAERFFKSGKRSGELADLKKELAALKDERDRTDVLASAYSRLVIERDEATSAYDDAIAQRGRTQARIDEVRRFIHALPRLRTYRALRSDLTPLAALSDAPSTWARDLPTLMTRQTTLATQTQTVADNIAVLEQELDGLVVNVSACGLEDRIELLSDLRARYVTAEKDLPDRRLRLGIAEQTVARVLARIDHVSEPDPARLLLPASVVAPLRDLTERRSGVEAALGAAEAEVAKAVEALSEAEAKAADRNDGCDEAKIGELTAAVAAARQADGTGRVRAADRLRRERADELGDRMNELRPWTGNRESLYAVPAPTQEQLERWASNERALSLEVVSRQGEQDRLAAETERLDARIDALGSVAGVVSDNDAAEARSAREAAWALHKSQLDEATAVAFESAMRKLDLITEQRLGHAARVAELNDALLKRSEVRSMLRRSSRQLQESLTKRAALVEEIGNAVRAIGQDLDVSMDAAGLASWLGKRDRAIDADGRLEAAERECREAQIEAAGSRGRIAAAMRSAGIDIADDSDIAAMSAVAQAALDRAFESRSLRAALEDRRRELASREKKLGHARLAEEAWNRAWRAVCATCWLGQREMQPSTAVVRETLEVLAELEAGLEKRAELTDRIAKMQRDQDQFRTQVEALALTLGLSSRPDLLELCHAVVDCFAAAVRTTDRRREVEARLIVEQDKARALVDEVGAVRAKTNAMMSHFGVGSLTEVDGRLRDLVRKSDLEARSIQALDELLQGIRAETIEQAETILDAVDADSLDAELIALQSRSEDEDGRTRDLFSARSRAEDRISAVGGDAAIAHLDAKRRTVLLAIEDKAVAYLRLRLGISAADRALNTYRERHRSSMMERASEAFRLISRGSYEELVTQPSNGSELLIAKGSDGGSKLASELSKGTRFQLYLALRVAGYHEFARAHPPGPFLADDIMETFDDSRAEEAFRLLADMACTGQVVYFTHHRHLCEIVKAVEPTTIIHDLQSGARDQARNKAA
ncbi:ATP-binding protein [Bradyrhizobium sp. 2S1]|uniref:ATP-binding protein n=1 Tax=Bradyrhizobium sp. 2S1 TaxID=1404429 RepID=UPI0014096DE6|nr:hypothetical protein [Bradyrhizobium sp. 2S1]MCK7666146.1 hypothetical protein [Bradyrhizobium sp. 2S1]